jgi:hypothetical protein
MNKTKELISEMRRYLGRDIHGLELLDKISEDVNAYRVKRTSRLALNELKVRLRLTKRFPSTDDLLDSVRLLNMLPAFPRKSASGLGQSRSR